MKVFFDDEREAPTGWTLIREPEELYQMLAIDRVVTHLSLDNDLGVYGQRPAVVLFKEHYFEDSSKLEKDLEGIDIADWLLWKCEQDDTFVPPHLAAHTANSVREVNILSIALYLEELHTCYICNSEIDARTAAGATKTIVGPNRKLVRVCRHHKGV